MVELGGLRVAAGLERGAIVAAAGDERGVDAEFGLRPLGELLVEICGGVGEGGEDEHLSIEPPVLCGRRVLHLFRDERFEFGKLRIALGRHGLRGIEQDRELVLVLLEILQPVIEAQVFEPIFELCRRRAARRRDLRHRRCRRVPVRVRWTRDSASARL